MESALEDITLRELIDLVIDSRLIDLHVSLPARVDSYNATAQTVDATPMVNKMVPDGAVPPNYVSEALPKLSDVPVQFQRCKQFTMTFPLVKGDMGMLVFSERNMATWRATGNQSDPGDLGLHTMSSAIFVPGIYPDKSAAQTADANNMILGSDTDGNSRIEVKPTGGINLGAGATKGVARNGDKLTASGPMATWASTVETAINALAPGTFLPANQFAGALPANPGGSNNFGSVTQGSSKIKAVD